MKYDIGIEYFASESIQVEADNVEEALEKAYENSQAGLCHYCAKRLELGDVRGVVVYDDKNKIVYNDL